MLKVLQQEIRKNRRRSSLLSFQSDLVIHEPLGRGGFGHVYRGTWHTTPAAVKVGAGFLHGKALTSMGDKVAFLGKLAVVPSRENSRVAIE
jgi:hypothetical protein